MSMPRSVSSRLSHTASLAACAAAMYSALVLDRAVELCFLELQEMAMPPKVKTKLEVDLSEICVDLS